MNPKIVLPAGQRLAGIEWIRGVAAFGVICIHSGLAVHNDTTTAAGNLRDLFKFAVPFFLMASFFFALRAEKIAWSRWGEKRAARILVPFVFWSLVYLGLHIAKLLLHHQNDQIGALFADPVSLILGGGTSLALYFLPLVLVGLVLIQIAGGWLNRFPVWGLLIGFLIAVAIDEFCDRNGYVFNMEASGPSAFIPRMAMALVEEGVRCAPVIFVAAGLVRYLPAPGGRNALLLLLAGIFLVVGEQLVSLPGSVVDSVLGTGSFLIGWGLSGFLGASKLAALVGLFSFGVYLVHQVFLEAIQVVFPTGREVGVLGTLAITALVYAASMGTVGVADRCGTWVRRIFGLRWERADRKR